MNKRLTSTTLKNELWSTLLAVKGKRIQPIVANAVATQSREIMRIIKTELSILSQSGNKPSQAMLHFTEKTDKQ